MAGGILIDSGNIVALLKTNGVSTVADELAKVVAIRLAAGPCPVPSPGRHVVYSSGTNEGTLSTETAAPLNAAINKDDDLEVSLKLYILDTSAGEHEVAAAFRECYERMGVKNVDMTLLAANIENNDAIGSEFLGMWKGLTSMRDAGLTSTIGVSDLTLSQLKALEATDAELPSIDQINLADCCIIPSDLVSYAKEKSIQLLAHTDPRNPWSPHKLDALVASAAHNLNAHSGGAAVAPTPRWIGRYQALVRSRGIVSSVGYVVCIE